MEKDKGFLQNSYEKTLDVIQEIPGGRYILGGIAALGILMNSENLSSEEIKSKIKTVFVGIDRDDKSTVLLSDPNCRYNEENISIMCTEQVKKTKPVRNPKTFELEMKDITEQKELTMPLSECKEIDEVTALRNLNNTKVIPNSGKECHFSDPEREREVKKILHIRDEILSKIKQCANEPDCDSFASIRSAIDPEYEDVNFKIGINRLFNPKCHEALWKIAREQKNLCPDLMIYEMGKDKIEIDLQNR